MANYAIYKIATGEVIGTGICVGNEYTNLVLETGLGIIESDEYKQWNSIYVDGSPVSIMDKQAFNITQSDTEVAVDETVSFINIPVNTECEVENNKYIISDGVLDLSFDLPGVFEVVFRNMRHIEQTKQVIVNS